MGLKNAFIFLAEQCCECGGFRSLTEFNGTYSQASAHRPWLSKPAKRPHLRGHDRKDFGFESRAAAAAAAAAAAVLTRSRRSDWHVLSCAFCRAPPPGPRPPREAPRGDALHASLQGEASSGAGNSPRTHPCFPGGRSFSDATTPQANKTPLRPLETPAEGRPTRRASLRNTRRLRKRPSVDGEAHAPYESPVSPPSRGRTGACAEVLEAVEREKGGGRDIKEMTQNRRSKGPGPSQAQCMGVDEEYPLSQTQTPSQVQRNLERHPQSQVEHKVNELVQFLLVKDQKKIPIKRADILKHVIKDYKDVFPEILSRANQTLQRVFGLNLVEIDAKYHTYILTSKFPPLEGERFQEDENTPKMGLLIVILSLIFMKGNVAKESAVWEMLRRLRVDCSGEKHKIFGDVKKLVTEEFVRQKYLEYTRLPHTDPPEFEFRWGPRATKETSKKQILQFVAKIQNENPSSWTCQYNEAEAEAGGAARS